MKNFKGTIIGLFVMAVLFAAAFMFDQTLLTDNITELGIFSLFGLMFLAGVLDGFNPCAFSTLLLWSGFLINRFGTSLDKDDVTEKRKVILSYASLYSLGIFTAYFLLGVGFLEIVNLTSRFTTSLLSQILAFVVIVLGLIMLRDSVISNKKAIIKMPKFLHPVHKKFSEPTTKLSSFLSGVVIGLCAIPCSGAIYMGILMVIGNNAAFLNIYPLLFVYNLGFILPVVILALTLTSKSLLTALSKDFMKSRSTMKLIIAIITILLGFMSLYLV